MVTEESALLYEAQEHLMATVSRCNSMGIRYMRDSGSEWPIPTETFFDSLEQVQGYIDRLQADPTVRNEWPRHTRRIMVEPHLTGREAEGEYQDSTHYQNGIIRIPPHGNHGRSQYLRELWVLHELAHYYDSDTGKSRHGFRFIKAYTTLIGVAMDPLFGMYARLAILRDIEDIMES